MPVNRQALIRYRKIDEKIRNKYKPYPTMDELIDACSEVLGTEVSRSSIEKDIKSMKDDDSLGYNAPIKFSRTHRGYYYEDPDYTIEQKSLSKEESEMVFLAMNTFFKLKNTGIISEYESAFSNIKEKLDLQINRDDLKILDFEHAPVASGGGMLLPLIQIIQDGKGLELDYHKFGTPDFETRHIFPVLLKEHRNRWYLLGFDYEKSAMRIFGLERIVEFTETNAIQPEELPDIETYFANSVGITVTDEKPVKVIFKANKFWSNYIDSQPIHSSQVKKKSDHLITEYELTVSITHDLKEKFLGFGSGVEIIEPLALREQIKNELIATLKHYQ